MSRTVAEGVYPRVFSKLQNEPIEDFRVDFEDGFGVRPDDEEDSAAVAAGRTSAEALRNGGLPAFFGIRIKPLSEEFGDRGLRTLRLYMDSIGTELPTRFLVTLPKVTGAAQVRALAEALDPYPDARMEIMIETPQAIFMLPQLVEAAAGRCIAAHFGAYDYTASLGITAAHQSILHPVCDFARSMMQTTLAGSGVRLADGATNILPLEPHRGADLTPTQKSENQAVVHAAWKLHYSQIRHSLYNGFYQGWDLHPAQLPARYAAVYSFCLEGMPTESERMRNFVAAAARSTQVRGVFDDAASGQGLLNSFLRALDCGAIDENQVPTLTGLSLEELRTGSFTKIVRMRS
jgi:citrate lyase beta subunit